VRRWPQPDDLWAEVDWPAIGIMGDVVKRDQDGYAAARTGICILPISMQFPGRQSRSQARFVFDMTVRGQGVVEAL
jgi:hypothetical protein